MTVFGALRGLSYLARDVYEAALWMVGERPAEVDGAERLAEREAAVDVSEPWDCPLCGWPIPMGEGGDDCGLGDRPAAQPRLATGPPNLWPDWCAAEIDQVADILLTADSPFALGYANDLRRAAQAHRSAAAEGNDPASVHERTLRQRSNEDRSGGLR